MCDTVTLSTELGEQPGNCGDLTGRSQRALLFEYAPWRHQRAATTRTKRDDTMKKPPKIFFSLFSLSSLYKFLQDFVYVASSGLLIVFGNRNKHAISPLIKRGYFLLFLFFPNFALGIVAH